MWNIGFTRLAEPAPGALVVAEDDGDDSFELTEAEAQHPESAAKLAVWQRVLDWMRGNTAAPPTPAASAEVESLAAAMLNSDSETERVGSAYSLGAAVRAGGESDGLALAALAEGMVHPTERVRRAATWGIGAAGDGAVPTLLELLAAAPAEASALSPLSQQEVTTNAACALGEAAETATAAIVDRLEQVALRTKTELDQQVAALPAERRAELESAHDRGPRGWDGLVYALAEEIPPVPHELRKTLAAVPQALGYVGQKAMTGQCDAPAVATRILRLLQGFQEYEDAAKIFPTHLSGDIAKAKAGRALLSMLAPAAHADRDVPARAQQAAYEVAIGRLREARGKTEAQRLVLAAIDGGDSASV